MLRFESGGSISNYKDKSSILMMDRTNIQVTDDGQGPNLRVKKKIM